MRNYNENALIRNVKLTNTPRTQQIIYHFYSDLMNAIESGVIQLRTIIQKACLLSPATILRWHLIRALA